jgi:hypothetical protein
MKAESTLSKDELYERYGRQRSNRRNEGRIHTASESASTAICYIKVGFCVTVRLRRLHPS